MLTEYAYAFVLIGGFVLLGAGIAYAKLRNVQAGKDDVVKGSTPPPSYESGTSKPEDRR